MLTRRLVCILVGLNHLIFQLQFDSVSRPVTGSSGSYQPQCIIVGVCVGYKVETAQCVPYAGNPFVLSVRSLTPERRISPAKGPLLWTFCMETEEIGMELNSVQVVLKVTFTDGV